MPNYSKLRELVSHRVCLEYDTGARIVGYLASCLPGTAGQVQFATLTGVELIDSDGELRGKHESLTVCPNVMTGFRLEEGPSGRDK